MTEEIVIGDRHYYKQSGEWRLKAQNKGAYDTYTNECCSPLLDEIERLRNALAEQTITHEVQKTNTLSEIERLRRCLQHAIDHVGKWGLFTVEEKQAILAEYEQVVRGD